MEIMELESSRTRSKSEDSTQVKKSSSLRSLDPILVNSVLRVSGRLSLASTAFEAKHQIILPKKDHVTNLVVEYYHQISGHSGREYVISLAREKFWIVNASSVVRKVLSKCFSCQRRQGPFCEHKMADLPVDRVTPGQPPFTSVSIDCFGPLQVRRGKIWGHFHVSCYARSTHRSGAQYGNWFFPDGAQEVYSKKGPGKGDQIQKWHQFHQQRERAQGIHQCMESQQDSRSCTPEEYQVELQPPVWLPLRRCLGALYLNYGKVSWTLLQTQTDDHEDLVTLLCEVESIINGRPITTVLGDSNGPEPLMPNHLLLLCSEPQMPPGLFQKEDSSWHRWRQVQYLAGIFWKGWSKEYLSLLQRRQKWTTICKNLAVVLVSTENSRQTLWPLGSGRSLLTRKVWCIVQGWK